MDLIPNGDRSGQQLAEFLSEVPGHSDEAAAMRAAVERAAAAVRAEVGAIVRADQLVCSVGATPGEWPVEALLQAAAGRVQTVPAPGARPWAVLAVPLEEAFPSALVLARSAGDFSPGDEALVRAMARVLGLTLRMLRTIESERVTREKSERRAEENARLVASLQERQTLFERLSRIQRSISHRAPITEVLDAITDGAAELLGDDVVGLRLIDPEDPGLVMLVSSRGMNPELTSSITRSPIEQGVGALAITSGQLVLTHDYAGLVRPLDALVAAGLQAAMAAPVFQEGEPIGSLVVASFDTHRRYGAVEQEMLLAFAEHASLAMNDAGAIDAMRKAFADALHQAHHDPLTGLPNRALVLERLHHAVGLPHHEQHTVGVLFVDLDRFKAVNDTMGHSVGDEVLIRVGQRLQASVRPEDTVGRMAGDEFVVVCEDVDDALLLEIAERAARAIEAPLRLSGGHAVITASIGVARFSSGQQAEDMLRDADFAMYRAKERGDGRIEVFDTAGSARPGQELPPSLPGRRARDRPLLAGRSRRRSRGAAHRPSDGEADPRRQG